METKLLIFKPGSLEPTEHIVDLGERPTYRGLQEIIGPLVGGRIEHVAVLYEGKRADMFVEENSASEGAANAAATDIYHAASRARGTLEIGAPWIFGTAVLSTRILWT